MSEPFIAEIRVMPYTFAPRGWARCDGQILPISQNTALFSLIGTLYGGNGTSSFGLPNLRDRFAMGAGQGPGLSQRSVGESTGADTVTLLSQNMPAHTHGLVASATSAATSPAGSAMAPTSTGGGNVYRAPGAPSAMSTAAIDPAGGSQPHENRQPYQALEFCICLQGVFPPRP